MPRKTRITLLSSRCSLAPCLFPLVPCLFPLVPFLFPIVPFLTFLLACTTQGKEPASTSPTNPPTRAALIQAFEDNRSMLYVYGTQDSMAAREYRNFLTDIAMQSHRTKVIVRSDREVTDAELQSHPVFLIGAPQSNSVLRRILPNLPVKITDNSLEFNQQRYSNHPVFTLGFYPNPLKPDHPLSVMTAMEDQDIIAHIRKRFRGQYYWFAYMGWGYELYDGGNRKVMGFFDDETTPGTWTIGGKRHWDFTGGEQVIKVHEGITFYNHQCRFRGEFHAWAIADSIGNAIRAQHRKIASTLGMETHVQPLDVHLYPSIEHKGLATGSTHPQSIGEDGSLHMVVLPKWDEHPTHVPNLIAIRQLLPATQVPALETGLALWPMNDWSPIGWSHWARTWADAGNALTLNELLDQEIWAHESPYLKTVMAAAMVDFIFTRWGKEKFLTLYQQDPKVVAQILSANEKDFESHLRRLTPKARSHSLEEHPHPALPSFSKAFNFAHEGYQIYNGYASTEAALSMNHLVREMHCNAVAIIPYAGYQNVKSPAWLEFSDGAGAENDESIVHCIWSAHQAGMQVLLKPQVWPWDSWTGEIEMQTDAEWELFFDRYYRWIRHYALMAEIYGAEVLCIGVEFSKATLQRPDHWRKMVERLRPLYHGKITYAANWGEEFERCAFWDALDYIGVNCYYPLATKDRPSQKELDRGFAQVMDKVGAIAQKAGKDVLFTEIGFRSVEKAWQNPHAEADGRSADPAAQTACYQAMIRGLQGRDWCKGVYLWKWPAYMEDAQYDPQGFTPLGKPSEALVKDWFSGQ